MPEELYTRDGEVWRKYIGVKNGTRYRHFNLTTGANEYQDVRESDVNSKLFTF